MKAMGTPVRVALENPQPTDHDTKVCTHCQLLNPISENYPSTDGGALAISIGIEFVCAAGTAKALYLELLDSSCIHPTSPMSFIKRSISHDISIS